MERTEFYNDFLRPMGAYFQFGGFISQEESSFGVISTLRPKKLGLVEREADLLRLLMPHLQRAIQVHSRVVGLQNQLEVATDALDRLLVGVILVDSEGQVLFANQAAMKIVNQRDGLSISREGLTAGRSNEHAVLRQLICGASATSKGNGVHPGGMMLVSRPSLKRPFSLMVAPRPSNGFGLGPAHSAAIIFVSDPDSEIELEHVVLARLFGLTPAEAKLAASLMQGKSLEESAGELSITRETARTHLKRIFDKTSTHRQGELVHLLLTAVPQVRVG
jgi:DNA-binding CsgD family transcriptional regulator